jgi:hypothetical protein
MVGEPSERRPVPVTLPPSLDEWLTERADAAGVDRRELLVQLAATYRAAAEDDAASGLASAVEGAATDAATERVDDRLGSFRSSLDSQLEAIRKRIVQLKHETDEKAAAGRVSELATRTNGLEERLDDVEDAIETLREDAQERAAATDGDEMAGDAATDRTGTAGEDGGTTAGPELAERLDVVESKLVRVAHAVVELRDGAGRAGDAGVGDAHDTTPAELKRVAAREGLREARCAGCGEDVDLALLPDAACPHCDARFDGLAVDSPFEEPRLHVVDGEGGGEHATRSRAVGGDPHADADAESVTETGSGTGAGGR